MSASLTKLEKICSKNPTSILFARLAEAHLRQGEVKRASEVCRRGLRYRPSYATGHLVMGKCHLGAGRMEEARQEFQKVLQLDPDNVAAFWNLGRIELDLGWEDLAVRHFERARSVDPFNREIAVQLAALQKAVAPPREVPADDGLPEARDPAPEPEPAPPEADESPAPGPAEATDGEDRQELAALVQAFEASNGSGPGVQPEVESPAQASGPIPTYTLAELYAAQGFIQQAIEVLQRVCMRGSSNEQVKQRLEELKARSGTSGR